MLPPEECIIEIMTVPSTYHRTDAILNALAWCSQVANMFYEKCEIGVAISSIPVEGTTTSSAVHMSVHMDPAYHNCGTVFVLCHSATAGSLSPEPAYVLVKCPLPN